MLVEVKHEFGGIEISSSSWENMDVDYWGGVLKRKLQGNGVGARSLGLHATEVFNKVHFSTCA